MREAQNLKILLVDDEKIIRDTLGKYLRHAGHEVVEAKDGEEALEKIKKESFDLGITDVRMPKIDGLALLEKSREIKPELLFVIITAHRTLEVAIAALRLGAADFLTKPVKLLELDAVLEKTLRLVKLTSDRQQLQDTISGLQKIEHQRYGNQYLVGESLAIMQLREQVKTVVEGKCDSILVIGDTGVGKEMVAREIHYQATKDKKPFVAVSCPTLPDNLVESELFGHVKGSFTGATQDKPGYFEMANGGTLFLDEVADLSASAQASLLRVLETRTLRRVGGSKEIQVDIRIIAATNAPLEEFVQQGKFRQDLYYRLNVYMITILPLRERKDDILPLAYHFLNNYANVRGLSFSGFSSGAQETLSSYDYPGNVRELRNIVERAAILCRSGEIQKEHLNIVNNLVPKTSTPVTDIRVSPEAEENIIKSALQTNKWNRRETAKKLHIPYSTLCYKIKKYNIK